MRGAWRGGVARARVQRTAFRTLRSLAGGAATAAHRRRPRCSCASLSHALRQKHMMNLRRKGGGEQDNHGVASSMHEAGTMSLRHLRRSSM